jgi:hypothetical protein
MRNNTPARVVDAWSRAHIPGHIRQVTLDKGQHRYVFRCVTGREEDIFNAFAALAENAEWEFDWFDAATLAYQMGRRFEIC